MATTSKRSGATPAITHALDVAEVVDRGDVDALREALVVAQERGDVVPHRAVDVHHRLAVRVDGHGPGEPLDERGRDGGSVAVVHDRFGTVVVGTSSQAFVPTSRTARGLGSTVALLDVHDPRRRPC